MTEETLSDKISDAQMQPQGKYDDYVKAIRVKDVKNFIKKLKERWCVCDIYKDGFKCEACSFIDKLAGDKLK